MLSTVVELPVFQGIEDRHLPLTEKRGVELLQIQVLGSRPSPEARERDGRQKQHTGDPTGGAEHQTFFFLRAR